MRGPYILKVSHANSRPILFLPDRETNTSLPEGGTPIEAGGEQCSANCVKVAVNVVRNEGSNDNPLPSLLRGWFGPVAGTPGTRHQVKLSAGSNGKWLLEPIGRDSESQAD